jgi:hypothetical protein
MIEYSTRALGFAIIVMANTAFGESRTLKPYHYLANPNRSYGVTMAFSGKPEKPFVTIMIPADLLSGELVAEIQGRDFSFNLQIRDYFDYCKEVQFVLTREMIVGTKVTLRGRISNIQRVQYELELDQFYRFDLVQKRLDALRQRTIRRTPTRYPFPWQGVVLPPTPDRLPEPRPR